MYNQKVEAQKADLGLCSVFGHPAYQVKNHLILYVEPDFTHKNAITLSYEVATTM